MAADVVSIEGGKKEICPHCGIWTEEEHPGNSCPRIAQVSLTDEGFHYIYVDIHQWERFVEGHGRSLPGCMDE